MKPETAKAVALVQAGTHTPYAAAKLCKIAQSTLSRALKRIDQICPACGGTGRKK